MRFCRHPTEFASRLSLSPPLAPPTDVPPNAGSEGPVLSRVIKKKSELNLRVWVERLKHHDPNRRLYAAMVLGAVGPRARSAVPELADLLVDRHAEIRKTAAVALGEIGPAAAPAVSALTRCVTDCDESVRRRAGPPPRAR